MKPVLQGIDIFARRKGWLRWHKTKPRNLTCPACQETNLMASRLDTASPAHKFHRFALFECPNCKTGHFPNLKPPAYETDEYCNSAARKFYIEQGAGLLSMIQPLLKLPEKNKCSMLEVGCGYGFSLHFSRQALNWESYGFDPSSLAKAGAKDLKIPIRSEYLSSTTVLQNSSFDIVYSSEVIEHLTDPDQFLSSITNALSDDGVLSLTTPDIAGLRNDRNLESLLPLISAGSHIVLFSKAGLRALLQRSGYRYFDIQSSGDTLFVNASKNNPILANTKPFDHELYISYLEQQTKIFVEHKQLFTGFAGRLLKELINNERSDEAKKILEQLAHNWKEHYGFDLQKPAEIKTFLTNDLDFEDFAELIPFNLPVVLYHAGVLTLNTDKNTPNAIEYFDACTAIEGVFQTAYNQVNVVDLESLIVTGLARALSISLGANDDLLSANKRLQSFRQSGVLDDCKAAFQNAELAVFSAAANTGQWDVARPLADLISQHLIDQEITTNRDRSATIGLAMLALNDTFDRKAGLFWLEKTLINAPATEPWVGFLDVWGDHTVVFAAALLADGGQKQLAAQQDLVINGLLARPAKLADLGVLLALVEINAINEPKLANKLLTRASKLSQSQQDQEPALLVKNTQLKLFLSPKTSPELLDILRPQVGDYAKTGEHQQNLQFALGLDDLNRRQSPELACFWLQKAKTGTDETIIKEAEKALGIAQAQISQLIINASAQGNYEEIEQLLDLLPDGDNDQQTLYAMAMYWLNHKNEPKRAAKNFALAAKLTKNTSLHDQANFHQALAMTRFGDTKGAKAVALELFGDENNPITTSLLFDRKDELNDAIQQTGAK